MTPEQWMRVGLRICSIRKKRGISRRALSEIIGVSEGHIQGIEIGKENVTLDMAVRLGRALNISLDYLLMGVSPIPNAGDGVIRLRCDTQAKEIKKRYCSDSENANSNAHQKICASENKKEAKQEKRKVPVVNALQLGNRVREIRLRRGITEAFLAESIHITASHMSNIERGRKIPSVDIVVALAQTLGVSIDYIVLGIRPVIGAGNWNLHLHSSDEPAMKINASEE